MNDDSGKRLKAMIPVSVLTVGLLLPQCTTAIDEGTLRAQAAASEATSRERDSANEQPSFGPMIERLIVHPGDSTTNCVLDLDAGEFVVAPPDAYDLLRNRFDEATKSGRPVEPIIQWAQSSGADLTLAMTSPHVMLTLYEGLICPAGRFTTTTPGDVLKMIVEAKQQRGAYNKPPPLRMFQHPGPPHFDHAFAFQTREGGIGLLQIVGSTEEPRSVTIRYKLLVTEAAQPVKVPSRQLQVIHLQRIDSKDLLETLKQLKLIEDNLSAAAPKTNLLILRGDPALIEEAISLVELLDVPPQSANLSKPQVGKAAESPSTDHFPPPYEGPTDRPTNAATVTSTFALRHVYASQMAHDLKKQILQGRAGKGLMSSTDDRILTVSAPPDVMKRVQTFITVTDWPDAIERGPNNQYLQFTVMRTARSFFYACAIEDSEQAISNLLSLQVLAELKGDTKSKQFEDCQRGGVPDADWEASLRADWPGKKELMQRLVREWNRYPLQRIVENGGIAIGFGVKHACSAWFEGAPKEFYYLTVEPGRPEPGAREVPYFFSSLPPWWNANLDEAMLEPAAAPAAVTPALPANDDSAASAPDGYDHDRRKADELQRFQGTWPMDICDSENTTLHAPQKEVQTWKWAIDGNQIAWSRSEGEVWHLTFSIEPGRSPPEIDLTYLDGPFKGVTCQGVYQWGGVNKDMLMLSLQDPGAAGERPQTIKMTPGEQGPLIFLNPREPAIPHDSDQLNKELDSLQGTWSLEIIQTMSWPQPQGKGPGKSGQGGEQQWVINGDEITWTSPAGEEVRLSFTIDPTQSPKHLDMKYLNGPFRGKECQGIYERKGVSQKMLWLCLTDPLLKAARPTKFGMDSITRHTLIGLTPATPPPADAAADERMIVVEGVLLELNQPGSLTVVISLGADDGVKSGDILTISRQDKRIGSLKIAKVERDRATATIMTIEDVKALEVGDQVRNQLPERPQALNRQPPQTPAPQRNQEVPTGVLSGRFVYDGETPVAKDLFTGFASPDIEKPQERGPDGRLSGVEAIYREYLKHKVRPTTIDQSLRVGKDKGLADVVIWVVSEDIPWSPSPENQSPVTVQIKNASFVPRATAVIAGQSVIIENQDPVDQSVSGMFSRALNPPFNVLLKARSTESSGMIVLPVSEPFPGRICLQHCPWTSGFLFVHSNPYVAISQEDGSFRMPNLPIGEWEFQAWHPRSGYISDWPGLRGPRKKGRFTQKITAGDNRLAAIKLAPELFMVRNAVESGSLLGQWKVVAKTSGGEPVDKFNFDGMQWYLGKETLDIRPATINRDGAAEMPMPKSSYFVDNTQSPAHFNWTFGEGNMSVEIDGIYELKDDVLRVCFSQHGEPRPTGFETKGQNWTAYEFKRDPKE